LNAAHADETAEALVTTDAMGVFTHGCKLLAGYVKKLQAGGYNRRSNARDQRGRSSMVIPR
jgi:LDH2 family malate/lactate/ureidoglycolate dehydrogenase